MALGHRYYKDEVGERLTIFNNASLDRLVDGDKQEGIETYELVVISALLEYVNMQLLENPEEQDSIELDTTAPFPEMSLFVSVLIRLDLLNPEDIEKLLRMHVLFTQNAGRFSQPVESGLSPQAQKVLKEKLRGGHGRKAASTR